MSNAALTWAWGQHPTVPGTLRVAAKAVLAALADKANESWEAYPSNELLAEMTDLVDSSVRAALKALRDAGLIEDSGKRVGRTGRVMVWRLTGGEDVAVGPQTKSAEAGRIRQGSQSAVRGVQSAGGGSQSAVRGAPYKEEPSGTLRNLGPISSKRPNPEPMPPEVLARVKKLRGVR